MRIALGGGHAARMTCSPAAEGITDRAFPCLPAVAALAWTPKPSKDWLRFAALIRLHSNL